VHNFAIKYNNMDKKLNPVPFEILIAFEPRPRIDYRNVFPHIVSIFLHTLNIYLLFQCIINPKYLLRL
jgi:hypothetical protein